VNTYIAFLRGINVGAKNVKTLLASGNVIFETKLTNLEQMRTKIETTLEKEFGFTIYVILRKKEDIKKLITDNPFKHIVVTPETRFYVTFFSEKPQPKAIPYKSPEKDLKILRISENEVCTFLTVSKNRGTTDMMEFLEKEFGSPPSEAGKKMTTRNWNTVKKIAAL